MGSAGMAIPKVRTPWESKTSRVDQCADTRSDGVTVCATVNGGL